MLSKITRLNTSPGMPWLAQRCPLGGELKVSLPKETTRARGRSQQELASCRSHSQSGPFWPAWPWAPLQPPPAVAGQGSSGLPTLPPAPIPGRGGLAPSRGAALSEDPLALGGRANPISEPGRILRIPLQPSTKK
jgi:hypothetical protein